MMLSFLAFFLIFLLLGLLFSILSYGQKNESFFWIGTASLVVVFILFAVYFDFFRYLLEFSEVYLFLFIACIVVSIIYLILFQVNKGKRGLPSDHSEFLDDIISAEDEEWEA